MSSNRISMGRTGFFDSSDKENRVDPNQSRSRQAAKSRTRAKPLSPSPVERRAFFGTPYGERGRMPERPSRKPTRSSGRESGPWRVPFRRRSAAMRPVSQNAAVHRSGGDSRGVAKGRRLGRPPPPATCAAAFGPERRLAAQAALWRTSRGSARGRARAPCRP